MYLQGGRGEGVVAIFARRNTPVARGERSCSSCRRSACLCTFPSLLIGLSAYMRGRGRSLNRSVTTTVPAVGVVDAGKDSSFDDISWGKRDS